jgi:hypothetical protein
MGTEQQRQQQGAFVPDCDQTEQHRCADRVAPYGVVVVKMRVTYQKSQGSSACASVKK